MVKIDLITGFLGSGKTTFLIKYAKYLMSKGERICILENDYGPINVDMMLIEELGCDREMVSGGCDYDCHLRRFRTKLIAMGMKRYDRVIVEPSGIYDTDEFFDVLYEDPVCDMYEIGNIFCLYDIKLHDLSYESKYVLTSEMACCGKLIVTKRDNKDIKLDLDYINNILKEFKCIRVFSEDDIIYNDNLDFDKLVNASYHNYDHIKVMINSDNNYDSLYYTDKNYKVADLLEKKKILFSSEFGNIVRIKGFVDDFGWKEINLTKKEEEIKNINNGQKVIIVIGENLNKEKINEVMEY